MGNSINFGSDYLKMSNGLTAVFIDVLTLAGSRLAQTEDEKRLIVWLAEKDQNIVGIGTVGFDICEMPWNTEHFEENKRFILKVTEAAEKRTDWDKLGYQPNEENIFSALKKFAELISKLSVNDIQSNTSEEWLASADLDDPILRGFPKCERHGILLTLFGCLICNAYTEEFFIDKTPARLYGERSDKVYLYVHGKNGGKEDAAAFAENAVVKGYQVLSIDIPNRADCKPWEAVPILQEVMCYAKSRWSEISLYAVSIGAWFSMLAFGGERLQKCLFVSPVLDMKLLIERMMMWAHISANELERRKLISTDFGETLDYEYFKFASENPINVWSFPTEILYGENDNLTDRETFEGFCKKFGCGLTFFENGEHWFHTEEQLTFLRKWEMENI